MLVAASATLDHVRAGSAVDLIMAAPAKDLVAAASAIQRVVTAEAADEVAAPPADETVVPAGALEVAAADLERPPAGSARRDVDVVRVLVERIDTDVDAIAERESEVPDPNLSERPGPVAPLDGRLDLPVVTEVIVPDEEEDGEVAAELTDDDQDLGTAHGIDAGRGSVSIRVERDSVVVLNLEARPICDLGAEKSRVPSRWLTTRRRVKSGACRRRRAGSLKIFV